MSAPIKKYRLNGVEIAEWSGKYGSNFTIRKSYKDKETGEYKESKSFDGRDLAVLAQLVSIALTSSLINETATDTSQPSFDNDKIPF